MRPNAFQRRTPKAAATNLAPIAGQTNNRLDMHAAPSPTQVTPRKGAIRMLRLAEVVKVTGLGKTTIYELQAAGAFPMRVKITARAVAWVEEEIQVWLETRLRASESRRAIDGTHPTLNQVRSSQTCVA